MKALLLGTFCAISVVQILIEKEFKTSMERKKKSMEFIARHVVLVGSPQGGPKLRMT